MHCGSFPDLDLQNGKTETVLVRKSGSTRVDAYLDGFLLIMFVNNDYTFALNVSKQQFDTKPTSELVPKIVFKPQQLTIDSLLQCVVEGRALCYSFTTKRQDGIITMSDKTEANFRFTYTVIYDFDKMNVSMTDYIETLLYKPSCAYSTYSNGKKGLYSFRLVYVFDKPIIGISAFNTQYQAIAYANGFIQETKGHGGWDKRNVSQFYYGTISQASKYISNIVYTVDDFEQCPNYSIESTTVSIAKAPDSSNFVTTIASGSTRFDPRFLNDYRNLPDKTFYNKYRDIFEPNYELSTETPLLMDDSELFFLYPEDYYCIYRKRKGKYTLKWQTGDDRKDKLFVAAMIMHHNHPSMSIENLLFNLCIEMHWYYDNSDKKVRKQDLIDAAVKAFKMPFKMKPSKHGSFRLNKPYWVEQGKSANEAKMIVRRYRKAREVEQYYNPELSLADNYRLLKEKEVKISRRTLERMRTRGDIKISILQGNNTDISYCRNSVRIQLLKLIDKNGKITQQELAEALRMSSRTIRRHLAAMNGIYIKRKGNNRAGRWELTLLARQELQKLKTPKNDKKD